MLTMETQPPQFLITITGEHVQILGSLSCHKCLGCMLPPGGSKVSTLETDFRLQVATKLFHANQHNLIHNRGVRRDVYIHDLFHMPAPYISFNSPTLVRLLQETAANGFGSVFLQPFRS